MTEEQAEQASLLISDIRYTEQSIARYVENKLRNADVDSKAIRVTIHIENFYHRGMSDFERFLNDLAKKAEKDLENSIVTFLNIELRKLKAKLEKL